MATGLKRHQKTGHLHFITFSCHRREANLGTPAARNLFENALERTRGHYRWEIIGYVVMPEHVHLLVSEPDGEILATALQALKLSVARRSQRSRFWQTRYYDFNVFSEGKRIEKLKYMHWNPVRRGLAENPEDWQWSSFRHYRDGELGRVKIESAWRTERKPT
jgi:putative transposase